MPKLFHDQKTGMLNLNWNKKSQFKQDLKCPKCQIELYSEKYLIEQCEVIPINRPDNIR